MQITVAAANTDPGAGAAQWERTPPSGEMAVRWTAADLGTALPVRKEDRSYVSPVSGDKSQVLGWAAWGTVIEVQRKKRLKEGGEKGPGPKKGALCLHTRGPVRP